MSEKGTVRGTLAPVLEEFEADFLPVGGYASATRVRDLSRLGSPERPLLLLYLGDHDPSGRGMSDLDLPQRLLRYASANPAIKDVWTERGVVEVYSKLWGLEVRRIALTVADTEALGDELAFPASDKEDDPRHEWFTETYGELCWELDAMNPNVLRERVASAIRAELDLDQWERYVRAEQTERESITRTLSTWNTISGLAREYQPEPST